MSRICQANDVNSATDLAFAAKHGRLFHRRSVRISPAYAQNLRLTKPRLLQVLELLDLTSVAVG